MSPARPGNAVLARSAPTPKKTAPLERQVKSKQPPAPIPPAPKAPPSRPMVRSGEVLFNFQAADIQAVVKTVSQMTGRNFLMDPRVKGKVTIISAKPVSKTAAYQIFISALKAQGFAAVAGPGGIVKIIPVAEGKQNARISTGAKPWGGDQMTTQVMIVQHGVATQLVPLLRPLMAPTSQLSAYAPANALIITDYARNIRRLLKIIGEVDQPLSTEVTVIPLLHSSALDLAELITRLSQARPGPARVATKGAQAGIGAERFTIIPDLRTNSLLVRTDNPGRLSQLRALISKLDVPAKPGGRTRVVYLRNANAEKLVEILRGLLKAEARQAGAAAKGKAADTSLIQADEATNSLIINATDAVYNNLRNVIEKLDVRRAQVFVEALIAEISVDKASELGFQWAAASSNIQKGGSGAGGVINFPLTGTGIINTVIDPISTLGSAAGLSLAYLGSEITLPDGSKVRGLGALARALVQKNYGNILSTPNLLTLDNAEAKIVVGQNVPFVTGSFAQAAGIGAAVNPFQTIQRRDVGITLKIKPQISEGGTIKLEIFQEVSDVERAVTTSAADIITNKRSLETTVVVEDGHTVVLGGLIEDKIKENIQRVPFLSRIPLLGALFRYREKRNEKTNLMIFLRPTIVRKPEDTIGFTASRYDYLRLQDPKKMAADRARILERFDPSKNKPAPSEDEEDTATSRLDDADELLGPPNIEDDEGIDLEEAEESEES